MITVVVSPSALQGEEVVVEGHGYRHLFRARRLAVGAVVKMVDGKGGSRLGRAADVSSASARFVLGEEAPSQEPDRHIELIAPIPKASRLSWMVEKATEIGVSAIHLVQYQRAPRKVGLGTLDRLGRVAVAAAEQSQRSVVPPITGTHRFSEVAGLLEAVSERWFLQPGAEVGEGNGSRAPAALLVGPEGGWSQSELEQMAEWRCLAMGLGPTILRIETAAVVGCARLLIGQVSG